MISKPKIKELVLIFVIIFTIILLFAFVDFLLHSLSEEYAVPPRYFPNKIIYGTLAKQQKEVVEKLGIIVPKKLGI